MVTSYPMPASETGLKSKLSRVEHLLSDANERLLEAQYEIFKTETSASAGITSSQQRNCQQLSSNIPTDLKRTIDDIGTIQSVLSCPIFKSIVNVSDSLDELAYHVNLRPSIGPSDVNINTDGELILAPPVTSAAINNYINSQLDDQQQHSVSDVQMQIDDHQYSNTCSQTEPITNLEKQNEKKQYISNANATTQMNSESTVVTTHHHIEYNPNNSRSYDVEKLVTNRKQDEQVVSKVAAARAVFEPSAVSPTTNRLYKANGHYALNQVAASNTTSSNSPLEYDQGSPVSGLSNSVQALCYSNEMYERGSAPANKPIDSQDIYINNVRPSVEAREPSNNEKVTTVHVQNRRTSTNGVSPPIPDCQKLRLADECDSGTSSFRSQAAKITPYSPQPHAVPNVVNETDLPVGDLDHDLIIKMSPEMEKIQVTLEKDANGLGVTVAGYTCEQEEISGIFIKSITPGSPADKSGKIRVLDQIFAVNGQEILGYSNPEAVNVLRRQPAKIVTLELMRYLADSKYKKLQTLLDHATPAANLTQRKLDQNTSHLVSPTKSMIPVSSGRSSQTNSKFENECIYKNTSIIQEQTNKARVPPIAKQRISPPASRVIETKQGVRNTIDIKSPMCQTTATYVNRTSDSTATRLSSSSDLEWSRDVQIVELFKDPVVGMGITVHECEDPRRKSSQSVIMISALNPGSVAERDGRLTCGDLLIFVDDTNLEGASKANASRALQRASGHVRLGVLKLQQGHD